MLGNIIYVGLCKLKHRRTKSIYAAENQHSSANQALMTSSVVDVIKIESLREVATSLRCHSSLLVSMLVSWLPLLSMSCWVTYLVHHHRYEVNVSRARCDMYPVHLGYEADASRQEGWMAGSPRINFYGACLYSLFTDTKLFKANHDSLPCRLNTSWRRAVLHYAPGIGYEAVIINYVWITSLSST
jgi:hypothetical protein